MIKLLVMDVDGTLTDGKLHIGNAGELFKSFHVRDGYAISHMLPEHQIKTAVLTARESDIVKRRAEELKIDVVRQNCEDKIAEFYSILNELRLCAKEAAYIGDDIPDLGCIRACAFSACPFDAAHKVKQEADFVSRFSGGGGAVREFAEKIIAENLKIQGTEGNTE